MGERGKPDQVIVEPEEFTEHHPNALGPIRHPDSGKGFDGQEVGQIVGCSVHIIHPVGVWNELMPGLAFPDFFDTPVMIADVHVDIGYGFTVECQNKPHQAVCADMVGAQIQQQFLFAVRPAEKDPGIQRLVEHGVCRRIWRHVGGSSGTGFQQRMPFPVIWQEKASEVWMAFEIVAEEVEDFSFVPVGVGPQTGEGGSGRM